MAKEKKKKKKKKKNSSSSNHAGATGEPRSGPEPLVPDPSKGKRLWETYRVPIVSAIVVVVFGWAWAPARHWIAGAFDEVHDFAVRGADFDAGKVDDMRERISSRPFWESDPHFDDNSLDFLSSHLSGPPVATLNGGSTSARVITVDELVDRAPDLDGEPVIVVGKFYSGTLLGGDILTLDREEVVITGNQNYAYIAIGAGSGEFGFRRYKDLVANLGVLVATGRAKATKSPEGVETAYFAAIEEIPVSPRNPDMRPAITALTG